MQRATIDKLRKRSHTWSCILEHVLFTHWCSFSQKGVLVVSLSWRLDITHYTKLTKSKWRLPTSLVGWVVAPGEPV